MLSANEAKCLELNAMERGVTEESMMEKAGAAVAREVLARYGSASRVVIVCGTGNNGGDGFVAARHLKGARVVLAKPPEQTRTQLARRKLAEWGGKPEVFSGKEFEGAEVIVDALLGTGASGNLLPPYDAIVSAVNSTSAKIVSVDCPSGMGSRTQMRSDLVVAFEGPKRGMEHVGAETVVADIGIPPEARLYTGIGEFAFYPLPPRDVHKGCMGRVLVLGGGPFPGAPVLAALAALRTGADLVTLLVPGNSAQCAFHFPELICKELPSTNRIDVSSMERIHEELASCDVLLLGPGAGRHPDTVDALKSVASQAKMPVVIDADGIKAMAGSTHHLAEMRGVITPHAKELEALTGIDTPKDPEARVAAVTELAGRFGTTVLFKAPVDVIAWKGGHRLNATGCPAMSVGGTGDVLAGVVAGIIARGAEPSHAARLGAYLTGLAGERAFSLYSHGMGPREVLEQVPFVIKDGLARIGAE